KATITASAPLVSGPSGMPMVCTARMPARTRLLARSVAPVKSSAMQPSSGRAMESALRGQRDAGEDLDHRRIVLAREAGRRGLHEHLVRGGRQRQRKLAGARGIEHQAEVLDEDV